MILLSVLFIINVLLLIIPWGKGQNINIPKLSSEFPLISILIPARNEEKYIQSCLESIQCQNYPKDKMQILVGDDGSTDATKEKVLELALKYPNIEYRPILQTKGNAIAKANVIANLMDHVRGEYILITDADTQPPHEWASTLTAALIQGYDLAGGLTIPKSGGNWFEESQSVDWLYYGSLMMDLSVIGRPCTIIGNNFGITSKMYNSTGGYENLPSTWVEDHELFNACQKNKSKTFLSSHAKTLCQTYSQPTLTTLMKQRKRWMSQFPKLDPLWQFILMAGGLWYPAWAISWILFPSLFLIGLILTLELLKLSYILFQAKRLEITYNWKTILLYPIYNSGILLLTTIWSLMKNKTDWKGRRK